MNKTAMLGLAAALLLGAGSANAAIGSVDPVPAATLLLPYFDIDPANPATTRTVMTVGNRASTDTVAHVVLWTDRGVPTFNFNVRLAANGVAEIDLGELFANGTLPQSTAGSFAACAATLPPAALDAAALDGLRNAHSGQASSLLGGQCGSSPLGDTHARGYATIDVVGDCTALVPGDAGYFVTGGAGVAKNANVLWGEQSSINAATGTAVGDTLVHIEASGTDPATTGASYTFYARRNGGSSADNREKLPSRWMGRYAFQDAIFRTVAQVWRDPGAVAPFACGNPPAAIKQYEVYAFNHQEQVSLAGEGTFLPLAAQSIDLGDASQARVPYTLGFMYYNLELRDEVPPFERRSQAYVSHVYSALSGDSGKSSAWNLGTDAGNLNVPLQQCSDGLDNDGDGLVDYPNDPGCTSPTAQSESPACSDGIDNDGDGLADYPADPGCASAADTIENPACNDGFDNDGDGQTDYPADPECSTAHDHSESFTARCDDGIDNDGDGFVDYPLDPQCSSYNDDSENYGQCDDGIDNDGDGLVDYPADPGCTSLQDTSEITPQCSDGIDNDGDGLIDFPADPGCLSANSNSESTVCSDGIDNDGDGLVDYPADPGCDSPLGFTEAPACSDGIDNDGDGLTDFPADTSCASASSTTERTQCSDGFDNDGDGLIDYPADPGCTSPSSNAEQPVECSDGADNNGDGLIDFPNDPNCTSADDISESPACSDGIDNDGDGLVDYPADPGCDSATDQTELSGNTVPQCADGIDNDGDGLVDYPADTGCSGVGDDVEFAPGGGGTGIVITPATLPSGQVGRFYSAALAASGGLSPYTFAVTGGALPPGLALGATGAITGLPTQTGVHAFTVTATDLNGFTGTIDYTINVNVAAVAVPHLAPAGLALLLMLTGLAAAFALRRRPA